MIEKEIQRGEERQVAGSESSCSTGGLFWSSFDGSNGVRLEVGWL